MVAIKRRWGMILVLAIIIGGGCWWHWHQNQSQQAVIPPVKADNRVLAQGIVYPVKYAQMVMPTEGTIGEVLVHEGDQVTAGQTIIRLVQGEYQARVSSAHSGVAQKEAAVQQARATLEGSQRELNRQQRMAASGATSRRELDEAKTTADHDQAALAAAKADLAAEQSKVSEEEGQKDKTEIKAPIDGNIAFLDTKVGEHANTGDVLVRIEDLTAWEIRSDDLTELEVAKVHVGDPVVLTFDGIGGLEIPGKVKFIRDYGEKKRGDITYTVFVAPEHWDDRLRWMMTSQIAITPSN